MARVLIVDDERGYCDNLEQALRRNGHDVASAGSAGEAIDVGVRYRPDVLIVDWMLPSSLNGLCVSAALRTLHPPLQTILMTGFCSSDLRQDAQRHHVTGLLEKPFTLEQLQNCVDRALHHEPQPSPGPAIAMIDLRADGTICHATPRAMELVRLATTGRAPTHIDEVFGASGLDLVRRANHAWVAVTPPGAAAARWRARARELPQQAGWLVVMCSEEDPPLESSTHVRMLLNDLPAGSVRWPRDGHVLLVDSQPTTRRLAASALRQVGCFCHAAHDGPTAERLLRQDATIDLVLIHAETADRENFSWRPTLDLALALRCIRPGITIVVSSRYDGREALRPAGVSLLLREPWGVEDLVNLLTGRIGNCVDCGLPIPLRRPRAGETPLHWECAACGARYLAVFDDLALPDSLGHVRKVSVRPQD